MSSNASGSFSGVRPPKLSEFLAQQIVDHIIREDLTPGTRLAPEHEMQEDFAVGRSTLREALRLLESRGVISIRAGAGGGAFVRRPKPEDLSEPLTLILGFQRGTMEHVVDARTELECLATSRAVERLNIDDLDSLADSVQRTKGCPEDRATFIEQTRRFHLIISDRCGNLPIQIFCRAVHSITSTAILDVPYSADRSLAVANAHAEILVHLRERDSAKAVASMEQHMEQSQEFWKTHTAGLDEMPVRWIQLLRSVNER